MIPPAPKGKGGRRYVIMEKQEVSSAGWDLEIPRDTACVKPLIHVYLLMKGYSKGSGTGQEDCKRLRRSLCWRCSFPTPRKKDGGAYG